jgi:hypothetical protein
MSTSDFSKLRHSESFILGVSPPANDLSPEVLKVARSGNESFGLKNTSRAFSTVDKVQWKDNVSGSVNRQ